MSTAKEPDDLLDRVKRALDGLMDLPIAEVQQALLLLTIYQRGEQGLPNDEGQRLCEWVDTVMFQLGAIANVLADEFSLSFPEGETEPLLRLTPRGEARGRKLAHEAQSQGDSE